MKNKKILIGVGVVIAGYLLWKKLQPKEKICVKWSQEQCVRSPCPQTCEQYK